MANDVKRLRIAAGMNGSQLARKSGLSDAGIAGLEAFPNRTPRGDHLLQLAAALNVTPEAVLGIEFARADK